MKRHLSLTLTFAAVLALLGLVLNAMAQDKTKDEVKKDEVKKDEVKKDAKKDDVKKDDAKKDDTKKDTKKDDVKKDDIVAKLNGAGIEVLQSTPAEFAAYMRSETEKWERVIKAANIRAD